jgi:Ca-activated chloride channel family protein
VRVLVVAMAVLLAVPAAARAQTVDTGNRAVIILDASKSMNDPAGNGGSRLDAAKSAFDELLQKLPRGAPVGLRVYGSKVSEASKAEACRDTELTVPVGPLDKSKLSGTVHALQGKGRTPIGASLLATPQDFGSSSGRRTVILVSDGGDNCAPPDPCKAAAEVAKQGVDLSISVVGLQVDERVRKQLECIARAGGGSYVGVTDAGQLGNELAAALARAFRSYQPSGTPVKGAPAAGAGAPNLGPGLFQDSLLPGESRSYSIDVPSGSKLLTSITAIPDKTVGGQGELDTTLSDPGGEEADSERGVLFGSHAGEDGREVSQAMNTGFTSQGGEFPPGRYTLKVSVADEGIEAKPVPIELGVQVLRPSEAPGLVRVNGELKPDATPTPTATQAAPGAVTSSASGGSTSWAVAVIVGVVGLVAGLVLASVLGRRR